MPKVFISYARMDATMIDELEPRLAESGIAVWRDQHNIYVGQQWPKVIGEAIADCDAVLLLWSASSAASHFVEFEWTTALALKKTIIPCLLDQTGLPPALAAINGIPCRMPDEALPKILAALPGEAQPMQNEQHAQVIAQLQCVTEIEPAAALAQARALFTQSNISAGGHFIQGGGDVQVTIHESRPYIPLFIAALVVVIFIAPAAFYVASRAVPSPSQPAPSPTVAETSYLRGQVDDERGAPLPGVTVRVDEINGRAEPMWSTTDSHGGFYVEKIPARIGDRVRVYVSKAGYVSEQGAAQHDEYIALPGPLKNVKLKRKK